jgi:hypothetical protein
MLRVAILGSALLLAVTGKVASAQPGEGAGAREGVGSRAGSASSSGSEDGAEGADSSKTRHGSNGVSIKKHGKFTGRVVSESALRKEPLGMPSGDLELRMLGLDESV